MLSVLKFCVTTLVLLTGAGAQSDICDDVSVLTANPTPEILTSAGIMGNPTFQPVDIINNLAFPVKCQVQITVSAGSSLKLNFTSLIHASNSFIDIYRQDPGVDSDRYVGVTINDVSDSKPSIYVFSASVFVGLRYDTLRTSFVMEYQEVAFEENICTMMSPVLADTTVREIVTPNFGNGPYFDNERCNLTIQSNVTGASEVKVEVTNHSMECDVDTITICDGVDCYNLCSTSPRLFRGNTVTVTFASDSFAAFAGMRLEYITDLSDWTPWVSMGCCEYRNRQLFTKDTRTRNCLIDSCQDELVQNRTRVCSRKCADCLLR